MTNKNRTHTTDERIVSDRPVVIVSSAEANNLTRAEREALYKFLPGYTGATEQKAS